MRINMNRKYLARAVKLGFDEVYLFSPKAPAFCRERDRSYVWALFDPESAVPPADEVIRIESPGRPECKTICNLPQPLRDVCP